MNSNLHKPHLAFLKWIWSSKLHEDDLVIDATLGNGFDSLFILKTILKTGHVYGLDVQQDAIDSTLKLLTKEHLDSLQHKRFHPYLICHSEIDTIPTLKKPMLVVYNLGYLPKGDKQKTTIASSTLSSLEKALKILDPKGLITVTIYPGHPEGKTEADAIESWVKTLTQKNLQILKFHTLNHETAPYVIVIQKRD